MAQKLFNKVSVSLSGVDLTTPVDGLKDGVSPKSRNFRLYAQQKDSRRVAVSTRKGPGEYSTPLLEAQNASQTASSTGTTEVTINHIVAQPFTASANGRLTRLDLKGDNNGGTGPLLVDVYDSKDGMPYKILATSSYSSLPSSEAYFSMRFITAPYMTSGNVYWIVARQQDNATGSYLLSTTTGDHAYTSSVGVALMTEQTYSLNFRTYFSPDYADKNAYRFDQDFGINRTLVAFADKMYVYNEDTKVFDVIKSGLNPLAEEYSYDNADGKAFWVNGYDDLMAWNGTMPATNPELILNGTFEVNATSWAATGGGTGNAIARTTGEFHSGIASLQVTATTGNRAAQQSMGMVKNREHEITVWVKGTAGDTASLYAVGPNITIPGSSTVTNGSWQQIKVRYTPLATVTALRILTAGVNFYIDDVSVKETGVEVILDTELPILKAITFHKNRLYGQVANSLNRFVYSEAPGIPAFDSSGVTPTLPTEQWYYAWLSVSFQEVPRPKNGSPITGMVSFQDNLIVLTQDMKYVWSGTDRGSFYLRESTGQEGALSFRSYTKDANTLYLVSKNGIFAFNGSKDEKLSKPIAPLFDACPRKKYMTPIVWKNHLRIYMSSESSNVNDICAIYSTEYETWLIDTECYVNRALAYNDADDNSELVEFSSLVPTMYKAEVDYNNLGAPIDFEYQMKYDSLGAPGQKKKIKRLMPIIQGADNTFPVTVAVDKDFADSPKEKTQLLTVEGAKWGQFKWGDGTKYGGNKSFKPKRVSTSGKARYWQVRVARRGVNNRVAFIGIQFTYKIKKL